MTARRDQLGGGFGLTAFEQCFYAFRQLSKLRSLFR